MIYSLLISLQAERDIAYLKKTDKRSYIKIEKLLVELIEHPYTGTGKPEVLKYSEGEVIARRITSKHRLLYTVDDEVVTVSIISAKGHYNDK